MISVHSSSRSNCNLQYPGLTVIGYYILPEAPSRGQASSHSQIPTDPREQSLKIRLFSEAYIQAQMLVQTTLS